MHRHRRYKHAQQQIMLALCAALSLLIVPLAPVTGNLSDSGGGGALAAAFYNNLFAAQPAAAQAGIVYGVDNNNDLGTLDIGTGTWTVIASLGSTLPADQVDALASVSDTVLLGNLDNNSGANFVRD